VFKIKEVNSNLTKLDTGSYCWILINIINAEQQKKVTEKGQSDTVRYRQEIIECYEEGSLSY
jgi:hypothetical protein